MIIPNLVMMLSIYSSIHLSFFILIRLGRQVLMPPRPTLLRAIRTNMTACASLVVAGAAVAGAGSKLFWLKV